MARFNFSPTTKLKAQFRQDMLCAACGTVDPYFVHHHIIPAQCGDPADPSHWVMSTIDNCVAICENCHWVVHESARWRNGHVAPPSYFRFSHGRRARGREGDRMNWLLTIEKTFERVVGTASRST